MPAGRPKIPIPGDKVLTLARYGMSIRKIADFFECDESVVRRRFASKIAKAHAEHSAQLRQKQWVRAMGGMTAEDAKNPDTGSDTMLVWLGKQDGQTDKAQTDLTSGGSPLFGRIERHIVKPTA